MQPQNPYGPPQQPYNPNTPPPQGQQPQPAQPYSQYPGQAVQPGQPQQPQPQYQQPQQYGQPPMPVYTPPANPRGNQNQPNDLPPPPPAPTTPYDFFMDQPKPHGSSNPLSPNGVRYGNSALGGGNGNSRFPLIIAGAVAAILVVVGLIFFLPKDTTSPQWFALAQKQQEVIRLCTLGSKAKYQTTRNFAITCQAGVTTNQKNLLSYMSKANMGYNSKSIGLLADSKLDARLKTAQSSSTYDTVFREIIQQQLNSYDRAITAQLAATTGANGRETLTKSQQSAELLIQMVKDDGDKTEATAATN